MFPLSTHHPRCLPHCHFQLVSKIIALLSYPKVHLLMDYCYCQMYQYQLTTHHLFQCQLFCHLMSHHLFPFFQLIQYHLQPYYPFSHCPLTHHLLTHHLVLHPLLSLLPDHLLCLLPHHLLLHPIITAASSPAMPAAPSLATSSPIFTAASSPAMLAAPSPAASSLVECNTNNQENSVVMEEVIDTVIIAITPYIMLSKSFLMYKTTYVS